MLAVEVVVKGLIAGTGTLFYSRMGSIPGLSRAAVFPALAPGLPSLFFWPVLRLIPGPIEGVGLATVIAGLIWAATGIRGSHQPARCGDGPATAFEEANRGQSDAAPVQREFSSLKMTAG